MDPVEFLREHAPFSDLDPASRKILGAGLEISYVETGGVLVQAGGDPLRVLSVLRKGEAEVQTTDGGTRRIGPGDCFGHTSLVSGDAPSVTIHAVEDCLVYTLPKATFEQLFRDAAGFAAYFSKDLARRLQARVGAPVSGDRASLAAPVRTLLRRQPVCGPVSLSVAEAARIMAREGVSSLLLTEASDGGVPVGMLTDRDLRRRVLAQGLGGSTLARDVMSAPVVTESIHATLFDVMLTMVQRRIHHLPVVDAGGKVRGVLTHDDLLRHVFHSPASLLKRIRRIDFDHPAREYAQDVSGLVAQLVNAGLGSVQIGAMVASLNDTLIRHYCALAEARLGPAPVEYAWIAFGSEGRREQALLTDQDNALVFAAPSDEARGDTDLYFCRLSKLVVDATIDSGIPACKGGYMATNWCMSVPEWVETFRGWARVPTPESVMHAANLYDFRKIHGTLDLDPLERAVLDSAKDQRFMAHFVRQALDKRPRLALLSRWLDLDRAVDLKAEGLVPLVGLARVHALAAGLRGGSTTERLHHAARAGAMESDRAESLEEAFRFLFRLRLEKQLAASGSDADPSNEIRLRSLAALDRRHLRDCLSYIEDARVAAMRKFNVETLG
ncbi:MAG: DUF294 nucleotidyltransferase-like domain-containing protein [Nannocystaceae bacterium]